MVSRNFDVNLFSTVSIDGAYTVIFSYGSTTAVTVEMQENLFEFLEISVRNGNLYIESSRGFSIDAGFTPILHITAPSLAGIRVDGTVNTRDWDKIVSPSFEITVGGASSLNIDMEVDELHVDVGGAVNLTLSGSATRVQISADGVISLSAFDLIANDVSVVLSGAGYAHVHAENTLNATINGVGSVRYSGNPTVTRNVAGLGTIAPR